MSNFFKYPKPIHRSMNMAIQAEATDELVKEQASLLAGLSTGDSYLCQVCLQVKFSDVSPSSWRTDITGHEGAGNVCKECLDKYNKEKDASTYMVECEDCGLVTMSDDCLFGRCPSCGYKVRRAKK